MKIIESTSPIKIDSIEKFNEAFGEQSEIAAIALSLAIARHVLLRETLPRWDANEYQKAANAFASVVESYGIAGASLGTNYRGWPSRLYIARDLRSYYLPIGKPVWEMLAREILNRDVKVDNVIIETEEKNEKEEKATNLEYEATPNPDNDEYDDEVVVDENPQMRERFVGVCRTIGELKDALFGAGRDWEVLILENNDESCGKNYVSCEAQWNTNSVCYFNDGSAPGENRELTTIADILEALDRFENDAEVYYYTATGSFNRLTRPWWGRDAIGGVDDDGSTRVFFKLAEGE